MLAVKKGHVSLLFDIVVIDIIYKEHTIKILHKGRYLIQSMDLTVDPCKDFYQFSCGGWEGMQTDSPQTFDNFGEIDPLSLMDMEIKANVLGTVFKYFRVFLLIL